MKILIVVTRGELGGAQSSVLNLARELTRLGYTVTVGFGSGDFLASALKEDGIAYHRFTYLRRSFNPIQNVRFISEIKEYIDDHDIDVVHFNSSNALLGALGAKRSLAKPKTVFTVRGLSFLDPNYGMNRLVKGMYYRIYKIFFRYIDAVVFVSKSNLRTAKESGLVRDGHVIYNGIPHEAKNVLSQGTAREKLCKNSSVNVEDEAFLIGSIGRLAYQKNYTFLIITMPAVLEKHPNARLVIIGEGPEREKCEQLIARLHLENNVYLAGAREYAVEYIPAFDLFVLPSIYEGMSVTMLEALSVGAPILATDVAGNSEIVSDDERQLYTLNDRDEFLRKLSTLIQNTAVRTDIGIENKQRADRFHIRYTGAGYAALYKQLVEQNC